MCETFGELLHVQILLPCFYVRDDSIDLQRDRALYEINIHSMKSRSIDSVQVCMSQYLSYVFVVSNLDSGTMVDMNRMIEGTRVREPHHSHFKR